MKVKSTSIIFATALLCLAANVSTAQTGASVWAVDFVKTKDGQQEDYLKFIELNWAKARQILREQGKIVSYQALSLPASKDAEWDVLLMTEYVDRETHTRREQIFAEVFKTRAATVPVNGKSSGREMADIKFDRVFSEPVSSGAGKVTFVTRPADAEDAAVRVPLENYIKGHATGDGEFMRKAFHPTAKIMSAREGELSQLTIEEFAARFTGKPAPDEAQRKRHIENVNVTGNAAAATVVLDYPSVKFTDYMSLLKVDGEWKIVNKTFYAEPKSKE